MKQNDILRKQTRLLKAKQGIKFAELAEYLEIKVNSFYSWLNGYYDLGADKQKQLQNIIDNLTEE